MMSHNKNECVHFILTRTWGGGGGFDKENQYEDNYTGVRIFTDSHWKVLNCQSYDNNFLIFNL